MSRRKRASMREGPLSDLFRSTADDAPADPPEAPRYGREDPAEAKKAAEEAPSAQESLTPEPVAEEPPAPEPVEESALYDQAEEPPAPVAESSESAPERLKRVFAEEPLPRERQWRGHS